MLRDSIEELLRIGENAKGTIVCVNDEGNVEDLGISSAKQLSLF